MGIKPDSLNKTGQKNNRGKLIQAIIVVATLASIVALSVVTQGPHDTRPTAGVVIVRIILLAGLTVLYFVMLYYTMGNHRGKKKDSHRFFFSRRELLGELIGKKGNHRSHKENSHSEKK
jgi:uncharacterized membrane protein